jgi:hypothetical protein
MKNNIIIIPKYVSEKDIKKYLLREVSKLRK